MSIESKNTQGTPVGGKQTFLGIEVANLIDRGEYQQNPYDFIEARRLLNNVLPKAVDVYVATERQAAFLLGVQTLGKTEEVDELLHSLEGNKKTPPASEGGS